MFSSRRTLPRMNLKPEESQYSDLFSTVYRWLHRRRDPRGYCPSGETLGVLHHLADSGPLTIEEAARHFDRSQASISERVARLVKRGLLTRIKDERDKRRHLVWLSPEGEQLIGVEREVLCTKLLERAMKEMPASDREALLRGTRALAKSASAVASLSSQTKNGNDQ